MATRDDEEILYKASTDETCRMTPRRRRCCIFSILLLTFLTSFLMFSWVMRLRLDICLLDDEICDPAGPYTPEQLHLSLGKHDHEYYVTWSTVEPTNTYLIWNRVESGVLQASKGQLFKELHESDTRKGERYEKYSYRAKMSVNLNTQYSYRVVACEPDNLSCRGRREGPGLVEVANYTSKQYNFTTKSFNDPNRPLNAIFYGDLGLLNAQSVPRLTKEIKQNDLIIHNGDFAYDLNTQEGKYGDRFMRLMEPIAARIPYQTSVGNHEIASNFSEYNQRFTMINRGPINTGALNNFFYSFNAGPIHFVAISTEFYYFIDRVGADPLVNQYEWLKQDLEKAASPIERAKRPWIVVFGHRPMYCSSRDHDDCCSDDNILRRGLPSVGGFALEKLFYDYGVDVELYSHEHQYERFLPVYDGKVYNGSDDAPYHNAGAPVHVISGSAGCEERLDPFEGHAAPGSIKRVSDYGFTRLIATRCKIEFEQISDDQDGTVVDHFVVSKNLLQNFPARGLPLKSC